MPKKLAAKNLPHVVSIKLLQDRMLNSSDLKNKITPLGHPIKYRCLEPEFIRFCTLREGEI
jgi:hypothetical protein